MSERKSDRWVSLTQSVLLHALVVGALAYGFYSYKQRPKPVPTLAIEGTVVDSKDLAPAQPEAKPLPPAPEPEPPPPEPVDVGPPTPTPEEQETQKKEAEEAQAKVEEQRKADEERVALEKRQADEKAAAEQQAREEAEKKAREEAEKKRQQEKREAEAKRIVEAKKQAEEKRKADEARMAAERENELRKNLEAEERLTALRSSSAMSSWTGQITARIQRAWLRPPSARPGIDCLVYVTQVPGGTVTDVRIGDCNGDASVRESIQAAVLRASPLPPPPDPALFESKLELHFAPTE